MKEYALFLGCLIPARLPYLEAISIRVLERFGIRIKAMNGTSCCPDPIVSESFDGKAWLMIAARNLSIAEEMKSDVLTLCNGCFSSLSRSNYLLKGDVNLKEEINNYLRQVNRKISGTIDVKHVAKVVHDLGPKKIKKQLRRQLKQWRVASHYGCHLVRPSSVLNLDDPIRPIIIDKIIGWIGAQPIDYTRKMLCCGAGIKEISPESNLAMLREKLASVRAAGANCVATPCPFCFIQLDMGQEEVNRKFNENYHIPVFYLTQLIGLALGFSAKDVGLQFHKTRLKSFQELQYIPRRADEE
ncbi:hypothetical protein A2W24_03770 [Microgenomates group bacterium RBG_16_45_19]|nr:MAG: hypothetical protein A2W24_03770 [Microgenomates group bacterium RBG_16_45_19]